MASAVTLLVTDCGDGSSSGTLRNTVGAAASNSIVQIPSSCSTITLDQGAIHIPSSITNLYVVGESPSDTVIAGSSNTLPLKAGRLFESKQTGTLGFSQLTLRGGHYYGAHNPRGGCVYSRGNVSLNTAIVSECAVEPYAGFATTRGGGIFAGGSVSLLRSEVTNNVAFAGPGESSRGGGVYGVVEVDLNTSTISGNKAVAGVAGSPATRGGGIFSAGYGNSVIKNSTISSNVADFNGAAEFRTNYSNTLSITSSTIADNYANQYQAVGAYLHTTVVNSTVAFNSAGTGSNTAPPGIYSNFQISIYNSIFANNLARSGVSEDIFGGGDGNPLPGTANLITSSSNPLPSGTLTSCPRLGHLANNGGLTATIALLKGSPALDVGAANGQTTDQRGTGFSRTAGSGTDIGAYERQAGVVDDEVFFSTFDLRCA
jgi:hypothetical protein